MDQPAEVIRARARIVVDGVLQDDAGFAAAVKAMVAHTIKEYRGRFLHELIQNGYDAHPADRRDGKIAVHFEPDEAEHGVLYVANGGRPLSSSNFSRIATLGQSDKPIGEGIGNKGVGFKSVFQVCDVPEVYSAVDESDPGFSGFSFRFGTRSDLVDMLEGDEERAKEVANDLSLSLLTVPLDTVPDQVARYRADGYVTVLRLPASSSKAGSEISGRIDRLLDSPAPVMLFLERLGSMSIKSAEQSGELTRLEERPGELGTKVVLNGDHHFRLFTARVDPARLFEALTEAVEEGALDSRWLEWDADAEVSVGLAGDDHPVDEPRAFTYLPMGDRATSPLAGHINAPFITDFARLGLDTEQPVNRVLLEALADLCLSSAEQIVAADGDANSLVDLLAWEGAELEVISARAIERGATSLQDFVSVPRRGGGWTNLVHAFDWPSDECEVITTDAAGLHGLHLLDRDRVDVRRRRRLERLADREEPGLYPSEIRLAALAEEIAEEMSGDLMNFDRWNRFYDDLPLLFSDGEALQGKRILLSSDGTLVPCDGGSAVTGKSRSKKRAVYFSPVRTGTEDDDAVDSDIDITPPRTFARLLIFTHPEITWYDGLQRRPGRNFLQQHGLAKPFRTSSLLAHLTNLLSDSPSDAMKRDALAFSYALFAADPTKHGKELAAARLFALTARGSWIPAAQVRFSRGWPVDGAEDLSAIAEAGEPGSELRSIEDVLLCRPADLPGPLVQPRAWIEFLKVIGVSVRLPVSFVTDRRRIYGRSLVTDVVADETAHPRMPAGVREQWRSGLELTGNIHHPETGFTTGGQICWFRGQHEIESQPGRVRMAYARAVLRSMPGVPPGWRTSTWSRERAGGWPSYVPTPLHIFLMTASWMPVSHPGGAKRSFEVPSSTWYVDQDDVRAASYSPLVESGVRAVIASLPDGPSHRGWVGVRSWADPDDAAELLEHLTRLFEANGTPEISADHFRASARWAWAEIGDEGREDRPEFDDGLLVERSGQLSLVPPDNRGAERVFISSSNEHSATARLVRELGWPMVVLEEGTSAQARVVAELLTESWDASATLASNWQVEVEVDGLAWEPDDAAVRLVDLVRWFPLFLATTIRNPSPGSVPVGRQLGRVLEDLDRVRVSCFESVQVRTPTGNQGLPARLRGVLPMPGDRPTLVVESREDDLTWHALESLTEGVLELLEISRFTADAILVLRNLRDLGIDVLEWPSSEVLAQCAGVSDKQVSEAESLVYGAVAGVVFKLSRVLPALFGRDALEHFRENATATIGRDALMELVTGICGGDERRGNEILDAATAAADPDALRRGLGIDIAAYNAALSESFPDASPISNEAAHREDFDLRVRHRRTSLRDWARGCRLARFGAYEPQDDWLGVRDLTFLGPDPDWFTTLDHLTTDVIDSRIDSQMVSMVGAATSVSNLPAWDLVRDANGAPLLALLSDIQRLIQAWTQKRDVLTPSLWVTVGCDVVRDRLDYAGALDFEPLDTEALVRWLSKIEAWPADMPLTSSLEELGLSDDDLVKQESAEAQARAERLRARNTVTLLGTELDVSEGMDELVALVKAHLATAPASLDSPYRTARLDSLTGSAKRGTRSGPGSKKRAPAPVRMSDSQRSAVGLAGELVAFSWLQAKDPFGDVDESCWKSTNVAHVFAGAIGDDSLGYDFEVPRRGGAVMYEVKATSGDAGVIEIGESEVRCAQQFSGSDRWRLLIVENALSESPRVHMLPNPFRPTNRGLFSFVGNSVRLNFRLQ